MAKKDHQTKKCCDVLALPPCTLPLISAGFADSVMFLGCMLSESRSLCYMTNWSLVNATVAFKNYFLKKNGEKKKTKRKGKRELYKLKKWESENFLYIFSVCIFIYYLFFCLLHHNYAQPVPTDSGLLWLNYEKFITRVKKRYTIISTLINFYRINSNLGYFRLKSIQIN